MTLSTEESITAAMDVPPSLHPYMVELTEGMDPLGGDVEGYLARLLPWLPTDGRRLEVLELACGKGSYSRSLARRFPHWSFFLVDASGPLLQEALRLVQAEQHPARFSFLQSDVRDFAAPTLADLVLFLGVGSAFAPLGEAASLCARQAREGALLMIDDCVTKPGLPLRPGAPPHLDRVRESLLLAGAEILVEEVLTEDHANRALLALLEENARRLAMARPDLRADIDAMVGCQRRATEDLQSKWDTVLWVLRVGA